MDESHVFTVSWPGGACLVSSPDAEIAGIAALLMSGKAAYVRLVDPANQDGERTDAWVRVPATLPVIIRRGYPAAPRRGSPGIVPATLVPASRS